jgi:hypothetical protein
VPVAILATGDIKACMEVLKEIKGGKNVVAK